MTKGEEGAHSDGTLSRSHKTASHKIDCLVLSLNYASHNQVVLALKF